MKPNDSTPYGSMMNDQYDDQQRYHPPCHHHPYHLPLLINEKMSSFQRHQKKKQHMLMTAWAFVVMVASYFVLTHSPTPSSVFLSSSTIKSLDNPEEWIKELPSSDSIKNFVHSYASNVHLAGSEKDRQLAEWTLEKWMEFGISSASIETYWPLLNLPISRKLSLLSSEKVSLFDATLDEKGDANPTFHGYSGDGNVTAPVTYVNYGTLEDFQLLHDNNITVNGTIALVRSGFIPHGLKVRAAQHFGCLGVLVYTDPSDQPSDGDTFPNGPWRSSSSVERDTVLYSSLLVGDPSTPGYASVENATHLLLNETNTVPHIPSLPISWDDATPFLKATEPFGIKVPEWKGSIPNVDYCSGPSQLLVHMVNINEYKPTPVWNVIGRIDGTEEPDRVILLGNHRDAWSYGAADPSSGAASLLETVRVFGVLLKNGWRPRRTIMFASWDAGAYGSIGSTEWVEHHKEWLDDVAVAYIDVGMAVSGTKFTAQSSPLLHRLLYDVTSSVVDPKTSLSVLEAWSLSSNTSYLHDENTLTMKKKENEFSLIEPLDAESDYAAFFHHIGISSMSIGFRGDYDVRHSHEDSIEWMEKFGDPTYEYHQTLVKIWGLLALRLSDDIILPMYPVDYVHQLEKHISLLESLYHHDNDDDLPDDDDDDDDDDDNDGDQIPCEPPVMIKKKHKNKKKEKQDIFLPKLVTALHDLKHTSKKFEHKSAKVMKKLGQVRISSKVGRKIEKLNARMSQFERVFINLDGFAGRSWYRHMVYAPGEWTGYQTMVLPSLIAAFESQEEQDVEKAEEHLANTLVIARRLLKGRYENDDLMDTE
ncbi:uncharacterized protein BX664DRAFT_335510 [Halteromyces radiatus]|uniref:uncharacterized protein n=1 Tax=Halteromyces radiatus TaxID=101107 RepID=UPI00221F2A37|nr:uncharacterized protein BX664DRAFT_335510 [Halteromyces radiatus]KAI8086318.1 hypothetical protein BX664DRAFT_335510 [Halteromyces radiatus]